MLTLDDIDRTILAALQRDGRASYSALAAEVGLAVSSAKERVRKLQESGAIEAVRARVSPVALGLDLLAFVFVGWSDPATEEPFLASVAVEPAILECHHVTGQWNYLLKVRTRTTRDLEAFLVGIVKRVPGVQRTETLIALSSPKETTDLAIEAAPHARRNGGGA